jgi:positive regulator of sigma E activity
MSTSPNHGDETNVPPSSSTVILLLLTMADTTWRLFIPSVGLTLLGLMLDKQLHTTPWWMIVGIVAGVTIAVLLLRAQMKKVKKQ